MAKIGYRETKAPEISAREELESIYSDVSKDAYGFRCRRDLSGFSDEELSEEITRLNRYGWEDELFRAAHEAGEEIGDVSRMGLAEILHRVEELRSREARPVTGGAGWRFLAA